MTPDPNRADTQAAASAPAGTSTRAKVRQKAIVRFPVRFHFAITLAMAQSLQRMTGGASLLAESDVGRIALHAYLLQNDPRYRQEMGVGNGG